MATVLYVFPDTNVFLQCKPLEQVDWSSFGEWDSIEILLTRPVQTEIDGLKGRGNGRKASRARAASALVRTLLESEGARTLLRSEPAVHLCLRYDLRRDESAASDLNYEERDDQLVGTALGFAKVNQDAKVCLLTNDTGPMASARAVGLSYHTVPEEWLLSPETEESEKRENSLKAELAQYKNSEPKFHLELVVPKEGRISEMVTMYSALSEGDLQDALARLFARHPLSTDFGSSQSEERLVDRGIVDGLLGRAKDVFEPATEDQIAQYQAAYSEWKQECRRKLLNLPGALNSRAISPKLTVRISNIGSRPAEDALVVFDVQGNVLLVPPKREADEGDVTEDAAEYALSRPPLSPKGTWTRIEPFSAFGSLAGFQGLQNAWRDEGVMNLANYRAPPNRDPNGIYFKEGKRGVPSTHIEF